MKKIAVIAMLAILTIFCGCQFNEINRNIENSKQLRVGMTKEQVLAVMGEPLTEEKFTTANLWFYYTSTKWHDGLVSEDECTPLVFQDGILTGWGNEYYNQRRLAGEYIQ